jgi:hypothetical protein
MYLISVYLLLIGLVLLLGTVLFAVAVAVVLARTVARLLAAYSQRIFTMLFLPHAPLVRRTQVIAYREADAGRMIPRARPAGVWEYEPHGFGPKIYTGPGCFVRCLDPRR